MSISINKNDSNFATPKALAVGTTAGLGAAAAVKIAPVAKDAYVKSAALQQGQIDAFKAKGKTVKQYLESWKAKLQDINAENIKKRLNNTKLSEEGKAKFKDVADDIINVGKKQKMKEIAKQAKIYDNGKPIKRFALKDSLSAVGEKIAKKAVALKDKVVNFAKADKKGEVLKSKAGQVKTAAAEKGKALKNVFNEFIKADKKGAWLKDHSAQLKKYGIPALIIGGTAIAATAVTKAILNHKAKSED